MRPPEFTGGNLESDDGISDNTFWRFNEAAGIHRRKPPTLPMRWNTVSIASMRPPEFTGGNLNCIRKVGHNELTLQ